ncbi:unnamed protein product [Ranitomeya imitator]|uniref:PiggyBac transposable element-derived protein domain-containing protein n=1 Tax=Ranitomeya imitator TaxID=111125 RepID=A0ABN9L5R8_9NEOB|nr:unnamed protein product [Ranitomeya imitator]
MVSARDDPDFDRLFKVRPVIEHFSKKFAEVHVPKRDICVDESLVHFKGRLRFHQYLPNKRARYGIILYKLCESTSGYTYSFRVYEGKDTRIEPPECPSILGVSGKIVWDLVHPLLDKGYHLYTDNFYSSIPLYKSLSARGTAACGTVRKNQRSHPKTLLGQMLRKGESKAQCSDHLLVVKCKDKRDVLFLTTIHGDGSALSSVRGTSPQVCKPDCVLGYNKNMGGVDLSDQLLQPYSALRKAKVWYKKLSVYIVQMAMLNAFLLSRCARHTDKSYLQFQEVVVKAQKFGTREGAGPSTSGTEGARIVPGQQFPGVIPPTDRKGTSGALQMEHDDRRPFHQSLHSKTSLLPFRAPKTHVHSPNRMNGARTSGFEADVGSRTTHHFMYPESAVNLSHGVHLVLVPFKLQDLRWITSALSTGEIKFTYTRVKQFIQADKDKVLIFNPTFFKYIHDNWTKHHGRYPSTGMLALFFALHICDEISVFGFGADQKGNWHHYWEKNKFAGAFKWTGVHNADFESRLIEALATEGRLKFYK